MKIDVFKKVRQTAEGKKFDSYLSRLTKKDGSTIPVNVKFKEGLEKPSEFPVTVIFDKGEANLASYEFNDTDGQTRIGYDLWLNKWTTEPYVDHSLDDYI